MTTSDAHVLAKRSRTAGARTASLLSLALLGAGAASADEAVLIGGGYTLQGSQGQIELNVRWVGNILAERGLPTTTFFTDGDAPGPDVHFAQPADAPGGPLEPLARVFGDLALERRRYREHAVPDVAGTTRRDALEPALGTLFERTSDEPLLLVYNGHGRQSPAAPAGVTLHLWDDTEMTARELHALLGRHRGDAPDPFRFVFTQCYSGGFHRLAYADADDGLALADTPRCGFTAESAYRLAEGCSAGVDIGDYRDYTTFFFAALADRERDGTALDRDPDTDADGTVTLREAHLHALEKAWSTDLSRSTSEDWLEAWQPWQLRWLPQPPSPPDNEYAELFRRLAVDAGIPLDGRVGRTLRERLADDEDRLAALSSERATLREDIDVARDALRRHATERRPELAGPYTGGYVALAASGELERVAEELAEMPGYRALLERQTRDAGLESEILAAERDATRSRKLLRLRRLATLKGQLETHGSDAERASYASLLACEEQPLVIGPPTDTATLDD